MAPSSRDDRPDADASRPPDTEQTRQPGQAPERAGRENEPIDFGAFVSRSVRSSSDRFRSSGGGRSRGAGPREQEDAAGADAPSREAGSSRPPRSRRYWRDSLREQTGDTVEPEPTGSRRFLAGPEEGPEEDEIAGGGGGIGDVWSRLTSGGDDGGPNRPLIAWFLGGLIVMLLVIFLLIRLFGGGGNEPSPTPTPTSTTPSEVIVPPGSGPESTPTATLPVEAPQTEPTGEPPVRRGGDNQIGIPQSTPSSGRQGTSLTPAAESPLAKECTERCLVRVEAPDIGKVMDETGNRPSFSVDNLAWVVATPVQVSLLDERADVAFVEDSDETLHLYVIKIPEGGDASLINDYGAVLDESGRFRLIRIDELPARVSTLANKGFDISKVAPAPVAQTQETATTPIGNVSGGQLMGEVSDANIAEIITTLQASGSTDGTGIGTRYYTYAGNQIAADYLYQQLESFGLNVWFEEFLSPEGILLVNVVGEIPGRDDSAVYAVMAHLDSINVEASPSTAPGADDNSTGMAATLEMARILAQYQLEHPVRFVFVNGEEVGILGASAWARRANAENLPIEGVFNIDSVGSNRQGRLLIFNSDENSAWMQRLMIRVNDSWGLGQEIMSRTNPKIIADDNMVREQGIEAVMIARELYGWSPLHHSVRDTEDKVDIENVMTTTYLVMLSLVELVTP